MDDRGLLRRGHGTDDGRVVSSDEATAVPTAAAAAAAAAAADAPGDGDAGSVCDDDDVSSSAGGSFASAASSTTSADPPRVSSFARSTEASVLLGLGRDDVDVDGDGDGDGGRRDRRNAAWGADELAAAAARTAARTRTGTGTAMRADAAFAGGDGGDDGYDGDGSGDGRGGDDRPPRALGGWGPGASPSRDDAGLCRPPGNAAAIDGDFRRLALWLPAVWALLVWAVLRLAPPGSYRRLDAGEAAALGVQTAVLLFANLSRLVLLGWRRGVRGSLSGFVRCVCVVQAIALATNALLLWRPTPVAVDPVTGQRVHLLRWAEWTPLAGAMMFLVEGVDNPPTPAPVAPASKGGRRRRRARAWAWTWASPGHNPLAFRQGIVLFLSTAAGLVLPLIPARRGAWRAAVLIVSCALFATVYLRVHQVSPSLRSRRVTASCGGVQSRLVSPLLFQNMSHVFAFPFVGMFAHACCLAVRLARRV